MDIGQRKVNARCEEKQVWRLREAHGAAAGCVFIFL